MTMSDSQGSPKVAIAPWQRQDASDDQHSAESEVEKNANERHDPPPSRAALLEQAAKFLEDEGIRDASDERKIAFLHMKGLTDEEISKVSDVSSSEQSMPTETSSEVCLLD